MRRMEACSCFSVTDDNGVVCVQSHAVTYYVSPVSANNPDLPNCTCPDWSLNLLPCKHTMAAILSEHVPWSSLSEYYCNFPLFVLDYDALCSNDPAFKVNKHVYSSEADYYARDRDVSDVAVVELDDRNNVLQLQSAVRQFLTSIKSETYVVTDHRVLQNAKLTLNRLLKDVRIPRLQRVHVRRKLVKRHTVATALRTRLASIRRKKRLRRLRKRLAASGNAA